MPETITLSAGDERLGFVNEARALVYPGVDVFHKPILTRTAMQVMWLGTEQFVCFPPRVDIDNYLVIRVEGHSYVDDILLLEVPDAPLSTDAGEIVVLVGNDGPVATVLIPPEGADGDRDEEDAALDESALSEMTKAQLLALASERGLTVSERMTKAWLIEALTGN
jgi:hypothetical protein